MTVTDSLALASLFISFYAFLHSVITSSKKYELEKDYRNDIMTWYQRTVHILIKLKLEGMHGFSDQSLKRELLSSLSSEIEVGRFYFPNIDKNDGYGNDKLMANMGYRNVVLEFLVWSYQIFERDNIKPYIYHAEKLQKMFTSSICQVVDPTKFLQSVKRHTNKVLSSNQSLEDFLSQKPEEVKIFTI